MSQLLQDFHKPVSHDLTARIWNNDALAADALGVAPQAGVLAWRRAIFVVAAAVNFATFLAEAALLARQPRRVGGEDDVPPALAGVGHGIALPPRRFAEPHLRAWHGLYPAERKRGGWGKGGAV